VTAYEALVDRLQVRPGETVLIDGASGGVGNAAVQIAGVAGARVYGVSSARNHDFVRSLGAMDVFDYNQPGWSEAVRAAVPGGVDVLLDTVGGGSTLEAFRAVKDGGRAALIASVAPDDIEKRGIKAETFSVTTNTERLEALLRLVDEGKLRVELQEVYPLSDAATALAKVKEGHTRGKIVLKTS
jgi:NADPH:quinone reductase-like Zn-dependent oxidoreductase